MQATDRRVLGRTGVHVSPVCLGTMMFGAWGNGDRQESIRIVHRALDAGVNFIDTADVYSDGESEEIVGAALAGGRRDDVVLATKFFNRMGDDPNRGGASRRWVTKAVDDSLRRLGTDWIDLYQVHRPDPATDIDETLGALTDLVRAGKVRYVGTSSFSPVALVEAQWASERRGRERFACEQPQYSILARGAEGDLLPACERYGMGVITYSPLAGGWLTGRYREGATGPDSVRAEQMPAAFNQRALHDPSLPKHRNKLAATEALARLAEEVGISLVEMALAFVLEHPAVTAPIVGPRTMGQLESQLDALAVELDDGVLDRIDEIVPPGSGFTGADASWVAPGYRRAARRRRSRPAFI